MRNVGCNSFVRLSVESRPESLKPVRSTVGGTGLVASTMTTSTCDTCDWFPAESRATALNVKLPSSSVTPSAVMSSIVISMVFPDANPLPVVSVSPPFSMAMKIESPGVTFPMRKVGV